MDRATAIRLSNLIETTLSGALKKEGFNLQIKSTQYNEETSTHSVVVWAVGASDPDKMKFDQWCALFGLTPADHNRQVTSQGKTFRVVALNSPRRKYCVIGVDETGRKFDLTRECLQQLRSNASTQQRVMVDFRCPHCNRPVEGVEDITHQNAKPSATQCQHCKRPVTVEWDDDSLSEEMHSWYFDTVEKARTTRRRTT